MEKFPKKSLPKAAGQRVTHSDQSLQTDGASPIATGKRLAEHLGYPVGLLKNIPSESVASFAGVGYFFHLAQFHAGSRIVDLGCGSGMDTFIAAAYAGEAGEVLGLDLIKAHIIEAGKLRDRHSFSQLSFQTGPLDRIPVADNSVDMVISNGVIHTVVDKGAVFREAARALKSGGRLLLADLVSQQPLPPDLREDPAFWSVRIGGILPVGAYTRLLEAAGLRLVIREDNPQYTFREESYRKIAQDFGIKSISLLAIKK